MDRNEIRSNAIINAIARNKNLDLRSRAASIEAELRECVEKGTGGDKALRWFGILIDINHAKVYGLGSQHHTDRDGGWGFSERDDQFLSSIRGQHLSNVYGIRIGCGMSGGFVPGPLTKRQVAAVARCMARPFYTLQLALVEPE